MEIETLKVDHRSTSDATTLSFWLAKLPKVIALDFEAASKFSDTEKGQFKVRLAEIEAEDNPEDFFEEARVLKQKLHSDGLSHPSLTKLTHMSIATSPTDAIVVVFDNPKVLKVALKWLVSTETLQIWHNASFDFKHIRYHTGRIPKNFEDSQQFAKSLLNHVEVWKANSGLKHLMGAYYGSWAVAPDMFHITNLHDKNLIKYAAIDACATYKLYELLLEDTNEDT